ncbi:outer membrane protein [Helicobacter suis]|uniref:Outer membrane protein Omp11 n=4 Tax=Helicobacter suis TaxID=104628 RepID=E7G5E7_9HELI|nr:outer membrane protein Omp11 [Helicobacter suis HS5]SFZ72211.1 OMP1486 [Helicobacter suis]BDR28726.1 membrane protein [Helicobacter suis HS1]SFZ72424.1 OMP20 [Helicobacter suis]SFZ72600.1 OMP1166 [Helicobacter suis]
MSLKRTFKSLTLSSLVAVSAMSVAQADEKNGFFLGLGYQQGRAGENAYRVPLTSGMHLYGLGAQIGGVGFVNKWFGGQIYGFFDYQNSPRIGANSNDKYNVYTYGGAADMIVNFIATSPFSMGLVGGIQLAGTTWDYKDWTLHTGFQFLFNVGGRIRIGDHSAIQAGIKFPMIPQNTNHNKNMMTRYYAWYVNYVFTF